MSRPPRGIKGRREAQEKSEAARQRMLDNFKKHQEAAGRERQNRKASLAVKRDRFSTLNVTGALAAASHLRFIDLEADGAREIVPLNRPILVLLGLFLTSLRERSSVVVLQWPRGSRDMSVLHPLAMLAILNSSPDRTTKGFKWSPAVADFRTLYYPWRGSGTGTTQRRILVERGEIMKRNALHLTRKQIGEPELSTELAYLHLTLGHLHHLKLRDATKPHLAHPTLGEIYPTFGALGSYDEQKPFGHALYELFGRVRHGAALDQLPDHRSAICQPDTAPFAFFGICPRSNVRLALQHSALVQGRSPDICILDLTPPGLARLGAAWESSIEDFLKLLVAHHPETPVIAITQDVYVHRRCARLIAKVGGATGTTENDMRRSRIIVRASDDLFAADPEITSVSEVGFHFHSAAGQGATALRALSDAARGIADPSSAGLIRHLIGNVRRAMSLPCGLGTAHEILNDADAGAEVFLERRSAGTVLAEIRRQIDISAESAEHQRLLKAERSVNAAFDEFEIDTPIGSMLASIAASIIRKSTPSVIAFASDYELTLGQRRVCGDDEQGEQFKKRMATGFIKLTTLDELDIELARIEHGQSRNSWKRLLVVAPPRDRFAILLGRKWLPEEIIVLTDREFVDRLGAIYEALASHPDLSGSGKIGGRLAKASEAAKTEARARDVGPIELDLEDRGPGITDEMVIDLTTGEDDDETDVIEFALESGRIMRTRPGSLVIRYDRLADLNPFERTTARTINGGNTIVVPNLAFVREARAILPVRVLAQTWVQVYHTAVESALPALPGVSRAAKARHIKERLRVAGARTVVENTVLDWLNAAEHKLVAPERLRPHAPQRGKEYYVFMDIINVPRSLAEKIWHEGIEPLRVDRRRAGARMAQAFVSVLVDPHGGIASMPTDVKDGIARLRRQALEHLDGVLSVKRQNNIEGGRL